MTSPPVRVERTSRLLADVRLLAFCDRMNATRAAQITGSYYIVETVVRQDGSRHQTTRELTGLEAERVRKADEQRRTKS